ncbi:MULTISPECIES: retron Eco8 family effector endonuclease [Aeromonas]|uniref:retron Eco8 family effector endonuclease n=1 Tax=Aeromonas TaxID=642 RepID=UPI001495D860|nr:MULTISPECIES: retron Eco8 family effector endonuclease [Aeromonas]MBA8780328.1 ATP-binding protein [Aeromonas caviae]MBA8784383.1 ATP-binding protein [Aeromonas sp. TW 6]
MAICSIKIENVLSFDTLEIKDIKDMNCIIGRNNAGKSNLLKALKFYYNKLEGLNTLPPRLHSNYSGKGSITLTFDTTRIFNIARKNKNNSYFQFIMRKLIPLHKRGFYSIGLYSTERTQYTLTLYVYNDHSVKWSTNDHQVKNLILYLYPFFFIEPRHMDLHEWDDLWDLVARLKSFNLSKISNNDVIDFFDSVINPDSSNSYRNYIQDLNQVMPTKKSTQKEKILSYIKAGLNGYKFEINESELEFQSDGTNSFHFIRLFLRILITISKREYITPFVYIDEPELGLHPKMNEVLISDIYGYYKYSDEYEKKTIQPKIFIATHSPNIVKEIIKKFNQRQNVLFFKKTHHSSTSIKKLNSEYNSDSFINIFSDNEARLFFSNFILFVEGETELEVFGNMKLSKHFPQLTKIDIYKSSSNVVGERVNPSYSNTAIPYLFLFDADKAWNISKDGKKSIINLTKNGNYFSLKRHDLIAERKKYSLGYSERYRAIKNNIDDLLYISSMKVSLSKTSQRFHKNVDLISIHNSINKYLLLKNCYINKTTFEGCLININSSKLFYLWLKEEHNIDMTPLVEKVSGRTFLDQEMLISYMRIIFNGKSETLSDYKALNIKPYNDAKRNNKAIDAKLLKSSLAAKKIMNILEKNTISNFDTGKTNGWATSFLNFSVGYIETESLKKKERFSKLFRVYFPELNDIIDMLQPDS